jgi:hypothetical protein
LALVFLFNNCESSSLDSSTCTFLAGALAFPFVGATVFPFFGTSTSESLRLDNSSSTFLAGALV